MIVTYVLSSYRPRICEGFARSLLRPIAKPRTRLVSCANILPSHVPEWSHPRRVRLTLSQHWAQLAQAPDLYPASTPRCICLPRAHAYHCSSSQCQVNTATRVCRSPAHTVLVIAHCSLSRCLCTPVTMVTCGVSASDVFVFRVRFWSISSWPNTLLLIGERRMVVDVLESTCTGMNIDNLKRVILNRAIRLPSSKSSFLSLYIASVLLENQSSMKYPCYRSLVARAMQCNGQRVCGKHLSLASSRYEHRT